MCITSGLSASLDPHILQLVSRFAQSGCVDKTEENAFDKDGILDGIAGSSLDITHDSSLLAQEGIEERGFTDIRRSDNRDRNTISDGIPCAERTHEFSKMGFYFRSQRLQFRAIGKLQFLMIGKVEFQLHKGCELQQPISQSIEFIGHGTSELAERQVFLCFGLRSNQVSHRLRTGKIHLPIEESATGELTRFRRFAARIDKPFEQGLLDIETTMTGYLHRIFSGKRMRSTEDRAEDFVENVGCTLNTTKMDGIWFCLSKRMVRLKKRVHDRDSLRATHADECNTSHTKGARYSANRRHGHQIERKDNTFFLHTQKN